MEEKIYIILAEWRGEMDGDGCSTPVAYTTSKLQAEYFVKKKKAQGDLLYRVLNFIESYYGSKYGSHECTKYLDPMPRSIFAPYTGRIKKYMEFDWRNEDDERKKKEIKDKLFYPLLEQASSDGIKPLYTSYEWYSYSNGIKKI